MSKVIFGGKKKTLTKSPKQNPKTIPVENCISVPLPDLYPI